MPREDFNLSLYAEFFDKGYTAGVDRMKRDLSDLDKKNKQAEASAQKLGAKYQQVGSSMAMVGAGMVAMGGTILGITGYVVKQAAAWETNSIAMEVLLKSKPLASKLMNDLKQFADYTIYTSQQVTDVAKQFLGYGYSAEQILPILKQVGNISAGLNLTLSDTAWLIGTSRSQTRLYGRDLMQFGTRGIPLLKELSKVMGISVSALQSGDNVISYDNMAKALANMTTGGGQFAGMLERLSQSATGLWSTLVDTLESVARTIGLSLLESLKDLMRTLIDVGKFVKVFVENNQALVGVVFKVIAGIGVLLTVLGGITVAGGGILIMIGSVSTALTTLGITLGAVLSPILIVIASIAALGGLVYLITKINGGIEYLKRLMENVALIFLVVYNNFKLAFTTIGTIFKIFGDIFSKVFELIAKGFEHVFGSKVQINIIGIAKKIDLVNFAFKNLNLMLVFATHLVSNFGNTWKDIAKGIMSSLAVIGSGFLALQTGNFSQFSKMVTNIPELLAKAWKPVGGIISESWKEAKASVDAFDKSLGGLTGKASGFKLSDISDAPVLSGDVPASKAKKAKKQKEVTVKDIENIKFGNVKDLGALTQNWQKHAQAIEASRLAYAKYTEETKSPMDMSAQIANWQANEANIEASTLAYQEYLKETKDSADTISDIGQAWSDMLAQIPTYYEIFNTFFTGVQELARTFVQDVGMQIYTFWDNADQLSKNITEMTGQVWEDMKVKAVNAISDMVYKWIWGLGVMAAKAIWFDGILAVGRKKRQTEDKVDAVKKIGTNAAEGSSTAMKAFAWNPILMFAMGALAFGAIMALTGQIAFAKGGVVPGSGSMDSVPAMLTPNEWVLNRPQQNWLKDALGVNGRNTGSGGININIAISGNTIMNDETVQMLSTQLVADIRRQLVV